ncbi:TPA: hypothetical protein EYN09_16465 [Candidatus Poribacteria bacterium]|nr:hypothetical protein [Candidatus Poribacteria bacterium]
MSHDPPVFCKHTLSLFDEVENSAYVMRQSVMKTIIGFSAILVLVLTLVIVLTVDAATPKDLIIHLPFEEGAGKVAKDISPNKFVGDVKNAKFG